MIPDETLGVAQLSITSIIVNLIYGRDIMAVSQIYWSEEEEYGDGKPFKCYAILK
jgi:hypothetical protein